MKVLYSTVLYCIIVHKSIKATYDNTMLSPICKYIMFQSCSIMRGKSVGIITQTGTREIETKISELTKSVTLAFVSWHKTASDVLAIAIPSVCPSVRPSVTRQYCVKTTARSPVQFALSDSKMCLVLQKPKIFPKDDPFPRNLVSK